MLPVSTEVLFLVVNCWTLVFDKNVIVWTQLKPGYNLKLSTYCVNSSVAFCLNNHSDRATSPVGMFAGSSNPIKNSENFIAGKSNLFSNLNCYKVKKRISMLKWKLKWNHSNSFKTLLYELSITVVGVHVQPEEILYRFF